LPAAVQSLVRYSACEIFVCGKKPFSSVADRIVSGPICWPVNELRNPATTTNNEAAMVNEPSVFRDLSLVSEMNRRKREGRKVEKIIGERAGAVRTAQGNVGSRSDSAV
jgi:hypothetical protein